MSDYYGRSLLEEPIKWSRWARLKAWYRGYTLPKTLTEAMAQHKRGISQIVDYELRAAKKERK